MKILHLNAFYDLGGAARATNRLHRDLLNREVESWMVVSRKDEDNKNVILCGSDGKVAKFVSMLRPYFDALPLSFFRNRNKSSWSISWLPNKLGKIQSKIIPDIVHVHWIGAGFLSLMNKMDLQNLP